MKTKNFLSSWWDFSKNHLSVLCAMLATVVFVATALPVYALSSFTDLNGTYTKTVVDTLDRYSKPVNGRTDTVFGASDKVTLCDFYEMLCYTMHSDKASDYNPIDNTNNEKGYIYLSAIRRLGQKDTGEHTFMSFDEFNKIIADKSYFDKEVTRLEAALFIGKVENKCYNKPIPATSKSFTDVKLTGEDKGYFDLVVSKGIMGGSGDGTFKPNQKLTRGDLAAIKLNLLNSGYLDPLGRKVRTTNLPSNASTFPYILEGVTNSEYERTPKISDPQKFRTPLDSYKIYAPGIKKGYKYITDMYYMPNGFDSKNPPSLEEFKQKFLTFGYEYGEIDVDSYYNSLIAQQANITIHKVEPLYIAPAEPFSIVMTHVVFTVNNCKDATMMNVFPFDSTNDMGMQRNVYKRGQTYDLYIDQPITIFEVGISDMRFVPYPLPTIVNGKHQYVGDEFGRIVIPDKN